VGSGGIAVQEIMFTKHLESYDIHQLADALQSAGVAGADLCVRPGHPVNPENASTALPMAAKTLEAAGLSIPLVTTPGDFTNAEIDYADTLLGACADAGVGLIKLGYWHMADDGYWATLERCRRDLEGLCRLCEKHGVKVIVHNHSGSSMGLNSCAARNLVQGFDPQHVGIFADTGHLTIVGEPLAMAVSIDGEYLSAFALKDLIRQPSPNGGWSIRVVPMGLGYVEWKALCQLINRNHFDGPISFHSEYGSLPPESVVDQTRIDVRFIDAMLNES